MPSAELLVVLAGHLLDVTTGEVLSDRALVLDGDRIRDVVEAGAAPRGRTIDLSGRTVLPGMIDCHAHLIGELDDGQGYGYLVTRSSAQEALTGVTNARATLLGGFTTVRDVGTFHAFVDLALRDAIEEGRLAGPRMMCAGAYVTCPGGAGTSPASLPTCWCRASSGWVCPPAPISARQRQADLRGGRRLHQGDRDGRRAYVRDEPGRARADRGRDRAAVEEAEARGTHVAAHAHGAEGAKRAIRAGVRSIEHGCLIDDETIDLMLERGTYLVCDMFDGDWMLQEDHASATRTR